MREYVENGGGSAGRLTLTRDEFTSTAPMSLWKF